MKYIFEIPGQKTEHIESVCGKTYCIFVIRFYEKYKYAAHGWLCTSEPKMDSMLVVYFIAFLFFLKKPFRLLLSNCKCVGY